MKTGPEDSGVSESLDGRGKGVRDRPFALRLQKSCDENTAVPAYNYGRQAWIKAQLQERFGVSVSNETVSKWFTGVARPRTDKISLLARLLDVDEAWLALGVAPELAPRERKIRNATADGAVNVVAGFIQMSGGHPAFPDEMDPGARGDARVDLYAIIKGAHYAFHVALAQRTSASVFKFAVPHGYEERVVVGVVQKEPLVCDFLALNQDMIEAHGVRRSGFVELTLELDGDRYMSAGQEWQRIRTFGERF